MESLEITPVRIKITSILKKALMSGEYKSGDELSLTAIAEKLGVSRTPVREAFQSLAAEGLIELRMNKGAIVKPIDEKFINDHYELRILLESEAAAKAAEKGMDVALLLEQLYQLADQTTDIPEQIYTNLNYEIHTAIWKAANNQKMIYILEGLWNGPSIGKNTSEQQHFRQSTEEHIQILLAIRDRQVERARRVMQQHIERSRDNILKSFLNQGTEV
jgi:DNA-binding GntR family transcriptional regulator